MQNQQVSKHLVAFATGWGSRFGGINVFNTLFLQQLGFACKGQVSVVCVVPTLPPGSLEQEPAREVQLIQLPYPTVEGRLDAIHASAAVEALKSAGLSLNPNGVVWLGHDRITGEIALQARKLVGGRVALIHHMSYEEYEGYAESSASASSKSELQRRLFVEADVRMAVGPLLRSALQDMVQDAGVTMLVPGLDEVRCVSAPNRFTAFMSGRLTADAAKIKQSHLGVAAFAEVQKRATTDRMLPESLRSRPRLVLRGVDMEPAAASSATPGVEYWTRFATNRAGRVVIVDALPYTLQREELLSELARSTVALMPSWHEGFGLAGWEAVAAGVPLILSQRSGLYQLLRDESNDGWTNWVYPVDVLGDVDEPYFQNQDLEQVSRHLVDIAQNPSGARNKAARLRESLSGYTWKKCVDSALAALDWPAPDSYTGPIIPPLPRSVVTDASHTDTSASPLEFPQARWQKGGVFAESQLLRAEEAAVAFDPAREPELNELTRWAQDPSYVAALRLITASGGVGKTRLAMELCTRLSNQGWHCGFLRLGVGPKEARSAWSRLAARGENVLVVFDYAETRQEALLGFLKAMLHPASGEIRSFVRIVLLARGGGEWWDRLPSRNAVTEAFLSAGATSGPVALPPLHVEMKEREAAFQEAVAAYAARMGLSRIQHFEVDLTGEHFGRPLYIQMAALLALRGERPTSAEGLAKALLHHEQRYWARLLNEPSFTEEFVESPSARYAAELMTLATLAGGFKRATDARRLWEAWEGSLGRELSAAQQRVLFEQLAHFYPGQQGLQPLRPDLLGEALVAHALLQQSGGGLLDALLGSGYTAQRRSALTVTARLSNHRPDTESVVVQSLARHFVPCATDLVIVATQSDSRLPEWAEQAFGSLPSSIRVQAAGVLSPSLAHETVQLAQLACAVSFAKLEKAKSKLRDRPRDVAVRAGYAEILASHAVSLMRAGRDPLPSSRQSLEIFEQLVARNPDRFEPGWAKSLSNHANYLANAGHDAEALIHARSALEIHRRLAKKDSGSFEPDLAKALGSYANQLSKNGLDAEAVLHTRSAVEILERLAAKDPDRYEPEWATSLCNYASHLSTEGLYAEALTHAQKALEIHGRLATESPDQYEPAWAASLSNYAYHLSNEGQYAEGLAHARIAREILGRLAAKNPDRFAADLAMSLNNYAAHLAENGQDAEALVQVQRAVEIFEPLALKNPDRYEPEWATSLSNFASHLSSNEQDREALTRTRKALEIRQRLAANRPERFEPDLVASLTNYAAHLADNGHDAEALMQARKASAIHERLAARNPNRFEPEWAMSLSNYANHLADNGRDGEGLVHSRKALEIFERLAIKRPRRFMEDAYTQTLEVQWFVWLTSAAAVDKRTSSKQQVSKTGSSPARRASGYERSRATHGFSLASIVEKHMRGALHLRSDDIMVMPPPDPAWCRPDRLRLLQTNYEWVNACFAREVTERAAAFERVLEIGWELGSGKFQKVEARWLCAAAWRVTHVADAVGGPDWRERFLQRWTKFYDRRSKQLPVAMNMVAQKMGFRWPHNTHGR